MDISRRELLRRGGGVSVAATASISGCLRVIERNTSTESTASETDEQSPGTDEQSTETDEEPSESTSEPSPSASSNFRQWLLPPDLTGGEPHYSFLYQDYETILRNETEFAADTFELFEDPGSLFTDYDLAIDDITATLGMDPLGSSPALVFGRFDAEVVRQTVENSGFEREGSVGEYTVYTQTSGLRTVAVKSGTLFSAPVEASVFETVLSVRNGDDDTYAAANDDMRLLLDELGDGTFVSGETSEESRETSVPEGVFEGQVASGYADTVTGGTTSTQLVRVFADESAIVMDDIRSFTDQGFLADYRDVSVSQDGRAVVITGETDTENLYT